VGRDRECRPGGLVRPHGADVDEYLDVLEEFLDAVAR
jgi:hypothetical protein